MALTNYKRVGDGLESLRAGLAPQIERELKNLYRDHAHSEVHGFVANDWLCGDCFPGGDVVHPCYGAWHAD